MFKWGFCAYAINDLSKGAGRMYTLVLENLLLFVDARWYDAYYTFHYLGQIKK